MLTWINHVPIVDWCFSSCRSNSNETTEKNDVWGSVRDVSERHLIFDLWTRKQWKNPKQWKNNPLITSLAAHWSFLQLFHLWPQREGRWKDRRRRDGEYGRNHEIDSNRSCPSLKRLVGTVKVAWKKGTLVPECGTCSLHGNTRSKLEWNDYHWLEAIFAMIENCIFCHHSWYGWNIFAMPTKSKNAHILERCIQSHSHSWIRLLTVCEEGERTLREEEINLFDLKMYTIIFDYSVLFDLKDVS